MRNFDPIEYSTTAITILPDSIVMVDTINQFKNRLDKYWKNYDFVYDHRATYTGTGGRF